MDKKQEDYLRYDFLARVAWAYYMDDLTQDSIAEQFHIPRIKVQRMLKEAVKANMVTISISNPYGNLLSCERELIQKFNLLDAVVVPSEDENLRRNLTCATAMYLERKWMSRIKLLGVGGGQTLSFLPEAFERITRGSGNQQLAVISLTGVLSPDAAMSSMDNGQQLAQTIGSTFYGIWSPGMAQTEEEYQVFVNQKSIRDALTMANGADIKIVSIGTMEDNYNGPILGEKKVDDLDYWELKEKNAVGELLAHFFDPEGSIIDHSVTRRSIVVDIPTRRGKIIAVSGGDFKIPAIRGALNGKLVDVLITDYETSKALLDS